MYLTRSSHFPSFPHFRFAGKSFPAKNLDLISRGFDENLLTRLKPLMFSDAKTPSISLSWLSLAIDFLSSTHNDAVTLFSDLRSSHNLDDSHGLYLDDSIKLLDLCNSISSEIEQLQKGRLLINFVLHLLDFSDEATKIPSPENLRRARNSLSDWMINNSSPELKKPNLPNAANLIRDLAVHLNNPPRGKISTVQKLIHHTTYAVVAVTVLVTSAVVSALTGSPPGTIRVRVPDRFLWSEAFNGLESAIFSQIRNNGEEKRRFIDDLDDVDRRVKSVCDVIDYLAGRDGFSEGGSGVDKRTLLNAVRELKTVAKNFSDGLDGLYNGVNVLFNTVLCTRNGVLEKFRS